MTHLWFIGFDGCMPHATPTNQSASFSFEGSFYIRHSTAQSNAPIIKLFHYSSANDVETREKLENRLWRSKKAFFFSRKSIRKRIRVKELIVSTLHSLFVSLPHTIAVVWKLQVKLVTTLHPPEKRANSTRLQDWRPSRQRRNYANCEQFTARHEHWVALWAADGEFA